MARISHVFKNIEKGTKFTFVSDESKTVFIKRTLKTYVPADNPKDIRTIGSTYTPVELA